MFCNILILFSWFLSVFTVTVLSIKIELHFAQICSSNSSDCKSGNVRPFLNVNFMNKIAFLNLLNDNKKITTYFYCNSSCKIRATLFAIQIQLSHSKNPNILWFCVMSCSQELVSSNMCFQGRRLQGCCPSSPVNTFFSFFPESLLQYAFPGEKVLYGIY